MIGYILGGLGVLGLFGIANAAQTNAAANLYRAVKDHPPTPPPPKPPPKDGLDFLKKFWEGGRG